MSKSANTPNVNDYAERMLMLIVSVSLVCTSFVAAGTVSLLIIGMLSGVVSEKIYVIGIGGLCTLVAYFYRALRLAVDAIVSTQQVPDRDQLGQSHSDPASTRHGPSNRYDDYT